MLPGGADWNLALPDGSIEVDARYTLRTHDGVIIAVFNHGIERTVMAKLFAGEPPDMSQPMYGRTIPRFEVADGPYGWLNRSLFAAELNRGGPNTAVLPIGRLGQADEIAATVLWLCSPGASFIIGVALPVEGGYTAQ